MKFSPHAFGFLFFTLASISFVQAGYYYDSTLEPMVESYVDLLERTADDNWASLSPEKRDQCEKRYAGILNDGVIDIRIALGYFDAFDGKALDPAAREALHDGLVAKCRGTARFCGFKEFSGGVYSKQVHIQGRPYTARIEMHSAAVTDQTSKNQGRNRSEQLQRTAFLENFYSAALQNADAVFYFGHSRNGGGPDFSPPVLDSHGKPDYSGYYLPRKPGYRLMERALSGSLTQAKVIGMMSCDSKDHFLKKIRPMAPQSGVIYSLAVMPLTHPYTAMVGGVDGLLRGKCGGYHKSLRMTPGNEQYISMDGMFERL
ncbi:MAG: hypothetical protein AB7O96_02255 [Pseudobdellovibrionaceae bacterium]